MEALQVAVEDNQTEQPASSSATTETQKAAAPKFSKLTRFSFTLPLYFFCNDEDLSCSHK